MPAENISTSTLASTFNLSQMSVEGSYTLWEAGSAITGYCDVWDKYCVNDRPSYEQEFNINVNGMTYF